MNCAPCYITYYGLDGDYLAHEFTGLAHGETEKMSIQQYNVEILDPNSVCAKSHPLFIEERHNLIDSLKDRAAKGTVINDALTEIGFTTVSTINGATKRLGLQIKRSLASRQRPSI